MVKNEWEIGQQRVGDGATENGEMGKRESGDGQERVEDGGKRMGRWAKRVGR